MLADGVVCAVVRWPRRPPAGSAVIVWLTPHFGGLRTKRGALGCLRISNTTSAVDGSASMPPDPARSPRSSPPRVRGKALTEEEELFLRGVAEKAVAQLVEKP